MQKPSRKSTTINVKMPILMNVKSLVIVQSLVQVWYESWKDFMNYKTCKNHEDCKKCKGYGDCKNCKNCFITVRTLRTCRTISTVRTVH